MRLSPIATGEEHKDAIWTVTWAAPVQGLEFQGLHPGDQELVMTASVDETVRVHREEDGGAKGARVCKEGHCYSGHLLGVISVDTLGEIAASSSLDSTIRAWDRATGATKAIIGLHPSELWSIAFNKAAPEMQLLAAAGGSAGLVKIWSIKDITPVEQASLPMPQPKQDSIKSRGPADSFTLSVAVSPDGKRLAAGAMDGTVAVFDIATSQLLHSIQGHCKAVRSLDFTPDSKQLLTASDDMHIHLYDVDNASLIEAFSGHSSWVLDVACHPNGLCFASGSSDASVKLWDLSTRTCAQTVDQHKDQVWSVAFRGDGQRLASVSDDQTLVLYEFAS